MSARLVPPAFAAAAVLFAAPAVAVPALLAGPVATAAAQAAEPTTPTPPAPTTPANPSAPSATTAGAEGVASTSATLTATVASGGADANAWFELGTTTAYGVSTPSLGVPAAPGTPTPVRIAATGLTASTTYHYRVVSSNAAGITRGADRTFRTAPAPARASVASVAATGVSATTATLPARITPRGQAGSVSFEWGTTKSLGTATAPTAYPADGTSLPVSTTLTGLAPNTRYYYRAIATNPTGRTVGRTRTFLTLRAVDGVSVRAGRTIVTWNASTVLTGVVSGAGVGGVRVALMRQDFPFSSAPKEVASMTTSDAGVYTFSVGPLRGATKLWVQTRTDPFRSSQLTSIRSRPQLSLRTERRTSRSSRVQLRSQPRLGKARASLQRRVRGRWVTIARPRLSHSKAANRTSFTKTIARRSTTERYRVVLDPRDGGEHLRATSGSVTVPRR